ncbi:hypothetical protein DJ031_11895 [bacterium endosymbiont of Escarpia laminata]|nr:MAG: hypothetical protein DJ031_11895 [bacterium endosymbiont of Escarpia laminata]
MSETVGIEYRPLCTVHFRHGYYFDRGQECFESLSANARQRIQDQADIHQDLEIQPTADSRLLINRYRLVYRQTEDGFLVAAPVSRDPDSGEPVFAAGLEAGFKLRFSLRLKNPHFLDFTNLPLDKLQGGIYHFSNDADNPEQNSLHLSRPLQGFSDAVQYQPGDLLIDDPLDPQQRLSAPDKIEAGDTFDIEDWQTSPPYKVYESGPIPAGEVATGDHVIHSGSVYVSQIDDPSGDFANSDHWLRQYSPLLQGVSRDDWLLLYPNHLSIALDNPQHYLKLRVFDLDAQMLLEETYDGDSERNEITVDLAGLKSGRYRLQLFGLIELEATTDDYRLLDGDGVLQSPDYLINFINRATYWRYQFPKPLSDDLIATPGDGLTVEAGTTPSRLITSNAQPLTRGFIPLLRNDTSQYLPNPTDTHSIHPEDGRVFSDIFLTS